MAFRRGVTGNHGALVLSKSLSTPHLFAIERSSSSSNFPKQPKHKNNNNHDRLSSVIDTVNDRKLPAELRGQRNNVRSETDIINVVEQRVYQAMEQGQFDNLPGKGKPFVDLNYCNPHSDPAEDTLYRILNKNGCAPEWVELNKDIRDSISAWRLALKRAYSSTTNVDDENSKLQSLQIQLRHINDKVFRYNLIVPFGRQMFGLKWEKEINRLNEVNQQMDK